MRRPTGEVVCTGLPLHALACEVEKGEHALGSKPGSLEHGRDGLWMMIRYRREQDSVDGWGE